MVVSVYSSEHKGSLNKIAARVVEAKEFWLAYDSSLTSEDNAKAVIVARWFGNMPEDYSQRLLRHFEDRFMVRSTAFNAIQNYLQNQLDHSEFLWLNHLYMLMNDPYYRFASANYLDERISMGALEISRDAFYKALSQKLPEGTSIATATKYGRNCLGALMENGLLKGDAKKSIASPPITPRTLALLLYTLAELGEGAMSFDGSPLFLSLLKTRELLLPTMIDGERLGYWEFTGDRTRLSLNLKYPSLRSWVQGILP